METVRTYEEMLANGEYCEACGGLVEAKPSGAPVHCKSCTHEAEAADHPVEDMFGSEIQTGDTWFKDSAGRIVLFENVEGYLLEVGGVEFFREIK